MVACRQDCDRRILAVLGIGLYLSGCGAALPPPGSNALTTGSVERKQTAVEAAGGGCSIELEGRRSTTVQSLLATARVAERDPRREGSDGQASVSPECAAARMRAQLAAIDHEPRDAATARGQAAELTVEFNADEERVAARDKPALSNFIASNRTAGRKTVRIYAGRGGGGNVFEQAVLAQKRARAVQAMLPSNVAVSIEFDPGQADDTVRLEFDKG